MKRIWLLLPALLVGCGGINSHDDVAEATLEANEDMNDILDDIKDKKSADAAKPKIQALTKRLQEIKKRQSELDEPSEEEFKRAVERETDERHMKSASRRQANMARIMGDPELGNYVMGMLMEVGVGGGG